MKFEYSKNYDEEIHNLRRQILILEKEKSDEMVKFCSDNKCNCDNCRYSCIQDVDMRDGCTMCMYRNSIYGGICDKYNGETEASEYLRNTNEFNIDLAEKYYDVTNEQIADAPLDKIKFFIECLHYLDNWSVLK